MSLKLKIRRFLRTIFHEDIRVILIFLVFVLSIFAIYGMLLGWLTQVGMQFHTPAIDGPYRSTMEDTDGDLLPDIVESTPEGTTVKIGLGYYTGTDTNPNDPDSDNDGFSDGIENNFGTNSHSWINPGFIWIVWAITIAIFVINKRKNKDMLREYREFENLQTSGGVASGSSKFAYGGSTIFSKPVSEMTEAEKKSKIANDIRYQRMIGEAQPEQIKIKRNNTKIVMQIIIIATFVLFIKYILTN